MIVFKKKMRLVFSVVVLIAAAVHGHLKTEGNDWSLDYDFSGYDNQVQLLINECRDDDIKQQINEALCGNKRTVRCIEMPTTNKDLPHVTCANDTLMGKVANFTLYKSDDDSLTGSVDRQRLEMKMSRHFIPAVLTKGTDYIYAWWFYLSPNLKTGDKFFHIFQLKTVIDSNPLLTFTLTKKTGFHIRWRTENRTGVIQESKQAIMDLPDVLGRWIQACVEVHYVNASSYFRVNLKDENGFQIFPLSNATGVFPCNHCNSHLDMGNITIISRLYLLILFD